MKSIYWISVIASIDALLPVKHDSAYETFLSCMQQRSTQNVSKVSDLEKHYDEVLLATLRFRNHPYHTWADYKGPWIENYFISYFMIKPLSFFNGLVPLFIQW